MISDQRSFANRLGRLNSGLLLKWGVVGSIFLLGLVLRLLNLTNPPLDFHPWRQLRGAYIARGMYYEALPTADPVLREKAIELGRTFAQEPPIFERLVAWTYLAIGGEHLWVARLYAILFWMVASVGVYALARRMTSEAGALLALAFFLITPYGVQASRSFQPDPLMVMWIVWAWYGLYRWSETLSWKWAIFAGTTSGIAVWVKAFAAFPIAPAAVLVVLAAMPLLRAVRSLQVWTMALLMVAIPASYYLRVGYSAEFASGWVTPFNHFLLSPRFYFTWLKMIDNLQGLPFVFAGLAAIFLLPRSGRLLLLGGWIGYFLFGLFVPSLIITHDYYNLPLLPVAALSLAPLGKIVAEKLVQQSRWAQLACAGVLLATLAYPAWLARNSMVAVDYRPEILGWQKMGRELPDNSSIIGITHDFGARIRYYGWTNVELWPYAQNQGIQDLVGGNRDYNDPAWENYFKNATQDYDYFLVTHFGELQAQPVLQRLLEQYPVVEGDGYLLYALKQK